MSKRSVPTDASIATGRIIPRYPLGPTSLEIVVMVRIHDGKVVPWEGTAPPPDGRRVIDDGEGVEKARSDLLECELGTSSRPLVDRSVVVRGGTEITLHAIDRAHRAILHIVDADVVPEDMRTGWIQGKIGVPKGEPPVRQMTLVRPGLQ